MIMTKIKTRLSLNQKIEDVQNCLLLLQQQTFDIQKDVLEGKLHIFELYKNIEHNKLKIKRLESEVFGDSLILYQNDSALVMHQTINNDCFGVMNNLEDSKVMERPIEFKFPLCSKGSNDMLDYQKRNEIAKDKLENSHQITATNDSFEDTIKDMRQTKGDNENQWTQSLENHTNFGQLHQCKYCSHNATVLHCLNLHVMAVHDQIENKKCSYDDCDR